METGSGKWYYEHTITAVGGENSVGIGASLTSAGAIGNLSTQYGYYFTGGKVNNATNTAYGSSYTTGDVIGVAYDATAGSITFYKNNVSQGVAFTGITGTMFALACTRTSGGQNSSNLNFGQRPFTYTPPTGFVALNTQNLSTPTIKNGAAYMAATTYTGTGASLTIANTVNSASFQPDFVWVKARSSATNNRLYDSVRGANLVLSSNTTDAETTPGGTGGVTAFNSNGFSLGSAGADNASAVTFIGWQWKAGTTSSSNTSGSITSTVSVGATQGFSVVTYTGNGTNPGATIGHGLGVSPAMIITKSRSGTGEWPSYHVSIGVTNTLYLNATYASSTYVNRFSAVSSTTFTTGSSGGELNTNGVTYVAYCFAAVAGYSAFGSYTGNGSANGPFVYLGFRPKFVMIKQSNGVTNWSIKDSSVNTYNAAVLRLYPNTSGAETSGADLDYLSNGFKCRTTSNEVNAEGTYIYMAFAENPFKYSLAR